MPSNDTRNDGGYVHPTLPDALSAALLHAFRFSSSLIKPKVCCHNQFDAEHLEHDLLCFDSTLGHQIIPIKRVSFYCKLPLMGSYQNQAHKLKSTRMIGTLTIRTLINWEKVEMDKGIYVSCQKFKVVVGGLAAHFRTFVCFLLRCRGRETKI
jgi:hypothetical protein